MEVKVLKFGGSSLADTAQFKKVKAIVQSDEARKYIVVSAPGKANPKDNKITDLLYLCKKHKEQNIPYHEIFSLISNRFMEIESGLELNVGMADELKKINKKIEEGATEDYIASRGEYLNGLLMAAYLSYSFVDAKDVIKFDQNGKFLSEETNTQLKKTLTKMGPCVIPGFYGSKETGEITTFSRGGSDVTGALVAKAVECTLYENWTDVSGFLMADPRIVKNPKPIEIISYKELRELSYMGASVLHEEAVFPVRRADIPINIRNTNQPDHKGTIIVSDDFAVKEPFVIAGVAGKKGFTVIAIYKTMMKSNPKFLRKLLSIFEDYNVTVEHMPSGIDTLSVVISDKVLKDKIEEIVEEIKVKLNPNSIDVYKDMALIATVGCGMANRRGAAATLFDALYKAHVNIRMIDQGSSEINIIVGVENEDFENGVKAIYEAFVGQKVDQEK